MNDAPTKGTRPTAEEWNRYFGTEQYDEELLAPDSLPAIRIVQGERHLAADQGLAAMHGANAPFYVRDNRLVYVCRTKGKAVDGADVYYPTVLPVTPPMIGRALALSATWHRTSKKGETYRTDPPKEVVEQIASMVEQWPFPALYGVTCTPIMRPDGTLLLNPGYDPRTGYVLFNPPDMPPIPDNPTREDAEQALALHLSLLDEFPFDNETSASVALSMIMTPVLRSALSPCVPMHVVRAPTACSGKSYLADICSVIATGDRCAVIAMTGGPDEIEKRLVAAAMSQSPIISLDNVTVLVMGDFLCQLIERAMLQPRPLGKSELRRIPNSSTVYLNGNNVAIGEDTVRRCLMAKLDAGMEDPGKRTFKSNPLADVEKNRGKYVAACLTIARAYVAAGRPGKLPQHPSYEKWSDTVRSALVWLGMADPVESIKAIQAEDPTRQQIRALFLALAEVVQPGARYQTGELIKLASEYDNEAGSHRYPELWDAMYAIGAPRNGNTAALEPRLIGHWLTKHTDNIAMGYRLTSDRSDVTRPRWILSPTQQ